MFARQVRLCRRTRDGQEVDFLLDGEGELVAIEVKRTSHFREAALASLRLFQGDYPMARCHLWYGGTRTYEVDGIRVSPLGEALRGLGDALGDESREKRRARSVRCKALRSCRRRRSSSPCWSRSPSPE